MRAPGVKNGLLMAPEGTIRGLGIFPSGERGRAPQRLA